MKILIIAHRYPAFDNLKENKDSFYLHIYAKQWNKMGNQVKVIHTAYNYPKLFNLLCGKVSCFKEYKIPWSNYQRKEYCADDIRINRIPLLKAVPHGSYFKFLIQKVCRKTKKDLEKENFVPDIIICDYINPGIRILNYLNKFYDVNTYAIIHEADLFFLKRHKKFAYTEKFEMLSGMGYRSLKLKNKIEQMVKTPNGFLVPSGVPEKNIKQGRCRNKIENILIVSSFIKRKHIDAVIKAVGLLNREGGKYSLDIIGDGTLRQELEGLAYQEFRGHGYQFLGSLPREEVFCYMEKADVFVLLSERETFGMVYLEAMSQGCLTIGSADEGIDGVIVNGINGFLLPAGDKQALIRLLRELKYWNHSKIEEVSQKAIETATSMSDEILAGDILNRMYQKEL